VVYPPTKGGIGRHIYQGVPQGSIGRHIYQGVPQGGSREPLLPLRTVKRLSGASLASQDRTERLSGASLASQDRTKRLSGASLASQDPSRRLSGASLASQDPQGGIYPGVHGMLHTYGIRHPA